MQPGSRLGPYEIVSRIGAGGMGEVWRARDTRLGREVAIKILPAEFAQDAKLKIRFEREAKTISRLTHPNICTLHDVGDGYLVMELLEGESVARRLARGPLSVTEVVRYGVQLAEALGKAHREGIVHRDVKPANIMLTKSGAKLLDFGLAKSNGAAASAEDETAPNPITAAGQVVGTFQYMAPEQLAGEEPDARTDIFALGAVLYEMSTGKRAFEGKERTDIVAAIVSGQPRPMRELRPLTPPALEHTIMRCLEKQRDDRWQSASDIAQELRWITESGAENGAPAINRRRRRLMWTAICGAVVIVAAIAWFFRGRTRVEPPTIESSIGFEAAGGFGSGPEFFALSPDGKALTFSAADKNGRRMLWVRNLAGPTLQLLANTEGARAAFWSPDGKFIAFDADRKLKKIPAGGGEPVVIGDAVIGGKGSWSADGVILYSPNSSSIVRVSDGGGRATVALDARSLGARIVMSPWFLPDANHFLFYAHGVTRPVPQPEGVWVATLDGKERPRFIAPADSDAMYVEPGWLLFARDGVLRAQRFDAKTCRLAGDSSAIGLVNCDAWHSSAAFAASNTGLLLYQKPMTLPPFELQLRNRAGQLLKVLGRDYFFAARVSDDGRRVAVDRSTATGPGDIWILGMDDGSQSRLTFDPANETGPVWSPDNRTVAYRRDTGALGIVAQRAGGIAENVLDLPGTGEIPNDWSSDGRFIAFTRYRQADDRDVLALSLATRKTIDVATTRAREAEATFSPDNRWIAYRSDESGRTEVYVQPFPPTGAKYQVSTSGAHSPRWPSANEIFYVDDQGRLTVARVEMTNGFFSHPPQTLPVVVGNRGGTSVWSDYDITPDGKVLVNAVISDTPPPLTLLTNWTRRLERAAKE